MGFLRRNLSNTFLFLLLSLPGFCSLYTLDNEMRVILEERHTTKFIAISAFVKAGSIYEDEYAGSGISHLVEHMLFKGTKKRKKDEIAGSIEKEGGEMGASTSFDKTVYRIIIPSSSAYIAFDILKDILFSPEFPEDELIKEKDVILREIETRDNAPTSLLARCLFSSAFTTHPIKHPIIGYKELFKALERPSLIAYHKERYIPSNIVLSICGDFEENELLNKIKRVFGNIPRGIEKKPFVPDEPPQVTKREFYYKRDVSLCYLNIGFRIPQITNPDIYALDILSVILGQGRTSRLYSSLREEKTLVASVDTWVLKGYFPSLFGVSATMIPSNLTKVKDGILYEIDRIKKDGVSQQELILAKRKIMADIYSQGETIEKRAYSLGDNFLDTGNPYFLDDYIKKLEEIKPSEIIEIAKKYLMPNNMTVAILLEETPAIQREEMAVKTRTMKKGILPNGLIYLISPSQTKGLVSIYTLFKGGRLFEHEGEEGISNLIASCLLKGTKNKGKTEIANYLESLGGSISSYGGRNSFGISLSCFSVDIKKGLLILKEILEEPAFSQEEIEQEKKQIIFSLKNRKDDLFSSCFDLFLKTLYSLHPYRISNLGTEESISRITKRDILLFYEDRIMPNNMVLTVFGDIDIEKTEKDIKNIFKGWKKKTFYRPKPYFEPPLTENRKLRVSDERFIQAGIMMGFLGTRINDEDRYGLELISSILSRQDGRLFNALREEEGLVYYSDAFNVFGIDPGCFIVYAQTSNENIERVCEKIEKEITRLKNEEVSIDELSASRLYLIGKKEAGKEDNALYGFEAGLNELYGISFEEIERYKERLESIDSASLKKIAEKYLTFQACVIISP